MSALSTGPILVVDDNESARYGKARTLRRAGYEVIEAGTGEDALRAAIEHEVRLAVLDVNLPDIDGWEVCRRLKADARTSAVVVLQVSATHVRQEDTVTALDSGADASLTEPFDPGVLVATVGALLRARQAEEALREALGREQVARSAAESANRAKDEFLAMLSHELRSPLGAILAWVTLLRTSKVDADQTARGLEAIERSTRQQVRLIEDLLDVSRIISGKLRLDVGEVDLEGVVIAAVESVRPAAETKAIAIDVEVDPMGPIAGDAGRLQQVVWNLLTNAVKFTPENGRVSVCLADCGEAVEIRVTDSGRGIDAELLPHVFERFRQGSSTVSRSESGLGLGLAIVTHVIALHGGEVHADSAGAGKGATFVVRLPVPPAGAPTAAVKHARSATEQPFGFASLAGLRILVLDDEPDTREAVSAVLEGCGAQVTAVARVPEALAFLERGAIDLVVSDVAMPGDDGYRFIEELRRTSDQGGEVPVLAFTAHAGPEERLRILEVGFDEFLAKPIEARELVAAVARMAARNRLR